MPLTFKQSIEAVMQPLKVQLKQLNDAVKGAGVPIGTIYPNLGEVLPAGHLWMWGGEFQRAAYPEFWTWVQQQGSRFITETSWQTKSTATEGGIGAVPYFSSGNGTTTFRVARLTDFHRAASTATASDSILDSAPNITGDIGKSTNQDHWYLHVFNGTGLPNDNVDGAFNVRAGATADVDGGSTNITNSTVAIDFDASRSDAAYGRASEVAPRHWFAPYIIKAYGQVINQGSLDVANIQSQVDAITNTTIPNATAPLTGINNLLHVRDEKPSGTGGGSFTRITWNERDLNTIKTNTITGASLSSNRITIPAGTYYSEFSTIAYVCDVHRCRVRDITNSVTLATAINGDTSPAAGISSPSTGSGVFTVSGETVIALQHYQNSSSNVATGYGLPMSSGEPEVYTTLKLWKVS